MAFLGQLDGICAGPGAGGSQHDEASRRENMSEFHGQVSLR
jgi:hypothetical protein